MTNLCGIYQLSQSNLHKTGSDLFSLVICTRKQVTPKKPSKYLLYKPKEGRSFYLSSLYPEGQEMPQKAFKFEVDGIYYNLTLDREKKEVTIDLHNSTSSINNVEFISKSDTKLAQNEGLKESKTGRKPIQKGSKTDQNDQI